MSPSLPDTRASLLLRLPNAEDMAAWDEFVSVYGPAVIRLARNLGMQPADADDLMQEVFTSVSGSISRWLSRQDRGSFRAWLFRIARNASLNFLTRRQHKSLATGQNDVLQNAVAPPEELSAQLDLEYRREVFRWAARKVQADVQETTWQAFWLTQVEGLEIADVAKQLRVNVGSVYIGRSRVMARLREVVQQFEEQQ
ncbi:MAG: sigma-70 family RNA polymerase sigma factor [Planctomycetaceae bacterium]|nr:sigma-70 family RNA polymerase sigma factor [Planctomycetaceae bacterium]